MDFKQSYVLVTAARNEEAYIENTLKSVIRQTILPVKWVIVSDGSTDRTDEIVSKYVQRYDFVRLLCRAGDNNRNFGSQVRAINTGYEQLKYLDFDFIGNLDADISFEPEYFERVLERFKQEPKLGLGGGCICEQYNGRYIPRAFNSVRSVPHAVQLFRRECYDSFGGYIPLKYGGPDWYAEVMARMNGWKVESFPEIRAFHHRHTLSADGILRGGFKQGLMDFSVGSHPLFEVFKCLARIKSKPYVLYAFIRLTGFMWAHFRKDKRMVSDEFVSYLRDEQIQRIKCWLLDKSRHHI